MHIRWPFAFVASAAALLAACGGGYDDDVSEAGPTIAEGSFAASTATLDGASYVVVRRLPADAVSAEYLEPAGDAETNAGAVPFAYVRVGDAAAEWELVSPGQDGWDVWTPRAVTAALGAAGNNAPVVSVEEVDWPDACLGLAASDESCAQVITPGYRIVVGDVVYHADRAGNVRLAGPAS